jgi:hypothetical protein
VGAKEKTDRLLAQNFDVLEAEEMPVTQKRTYGNRLLYGDILFSQRKGQSKISHMTSMY